MIRLFISEDLTQNIVPLSSEHIHYLYNVMRLKPGAQIEVFNGTQGGWKAVCQQKTAGYLCVTERLLSEPLALPDLHLYISLFKRLDWVLEKSTELGVTHIHPMVTQRSSVRSLNRVRAQRILQEASEQSGRYTVPELMPVVCFQEALQHTPKGWVAQRGSCSINCCTLKNIPWNLWVGPEGGWSESELNAFKVCKEIYFLSLTSLCLRTETSVVTGLMMLQTRI